MPQIKAMDKIYGMYRVLRRTNDEQEQHHFSNTYDFSKNAMSMVLHKYHK